MLGVSGSAVFVASSVADFSVILGKVKKLSIVICGAGLSLTSIPQAAHGQNEALPEFARDVLEVCLTAINNLERSYGVAQERGYVFAGDVNYSSEVWVKRFVSAEKGMFELAFSNADIVSPDCLFEKKTRLEANQISVLVQTLEADERVPQLKGKGKCEKQAVDGCRMIGYYDTTFPLVALLQPGEVGFHFSITRLKIPMTS
jgi:hypothetical protein